MFLSLKGTISSILVGHRMNDIQMLEWCHLLSPPWQSRTNGTLTLVQQGPKCQVCSSKTKLVQLFFPTVTSWSIETPPVCMELCPDDSSWLLLWWLSDKILTDWLYFILPFSPKRPNISPFTCPSHGPPRPFSCPSLTGAYSTLPRAHSSSGRPEHISTPAFSLWSGVKSALFHNTPGLAPAQRYSRLCPECPKNCEWH